MTQYVITPGDYWLGDPCYALGDKSWAEITETSAEFTKNPIELNGHQLMIFPTALGDGVFECSLGTIGVDAALIGIVPVEAADKEGGPQGMFRVTFAEPAVAEVKGSRLIFGPYDIDTNPTG